MIMFNDFNILNIITQCASIYKIWIFEVVNSKRHSLCMCIIGGFKLKYLTFEL
jgi:hypothetical protein